MKSFRWGILGSGTAARKFVLGLRAAKNAKATVVASRSLVNAQSFAKDLGIRNAIDDYQMVTKCSEIDAIYIATPPSFHCEHALMAIQAGKPVLVEKPFALNAEEARKIETAARINKVFCMEGMWTRFLPIIDRVKSMIDSGKIGNVCMMKGSFAIADLVSSNNNLYNAELGGGALLHRGIYPLSLAVYLLGYPNRATSEAIIGSTSIDEEIAILLRFENQALAELHASTRTNSLNDCWIMGTKGSIHIHSPIYRPFRMTITPVHPRNKSHNGNSLLMKLKENMIILRCYQRFGHFSSLLMNRKSKTMTIPYNGNGYHYQADEVQKAVKLGKLESKIMPLSESVKIMELVDNINNQWHNDKLC